jgi:hypothetical protein
LKPAPFDYAKPNSVEEVFDVLDRYGDDARLLTGGPRLLPSLNMRLSAPAILIDITGQFHKLPGGALIVALDVGFGSCGNSEWRARSAGLHAEKNGRSRLLDRRHGAASASHLPL